MDEKNTPTLNQSALTFDEKKRKLEKLLDREKQLQQLRWNTRKMRDTPHDESFILPSRALKYSRQIPVFLRAHRSPFFYLNAESSETAPRTNWTAKSQTIPPLANDNE